MSFVMRLLSDSFSFSVPLGHKEKEGKKPPVAVLVTVDGESGAEISRAHILILFLTLHFFSYFPNTNKDYLNKQTSRLKSDYQSYYHPRLPPLLL